jgi:putative ABC transport system substrate-binding protein
LAGKRLELLKEAIPKLSRIAIFRLRGSETEVKETEAAARLLKVQLISLEVQSLDELENAFRSSAKSRADAFIIMPSGFFNTNQRRLVELAAKHRLPGMYLEQEFVHAGGLMTYATSIPDLYRRSATYVDKILKGAKPADLPVEQPKKFEFLINLKTAKEIGLTIPPNVLARADQVIR